MIGLVKRPRSWRKGRLPAVLLTMLTALAVALGGCTAPPEPDPRASAATASLPDGAEVTVTFPGHGELDAEVEPGAVTPEMTAALPAPSAHISNLADFTLPEGEFPDAGAEVTFHRSEPPPSGAFSVIAHWNEQDNIWEPVKTSQTEDRLTLTATVEHFSAYSIIDFFKDIEGGYSDYKSGGWDDEGNSEGFEEAINGGGQWLGVQTAPPTCPDVPKPEWASVLGAADLTNIITSCASGSREHPGNIILRVTVNRSYAGYFLTGADPLCAQQDGFGTGHTDDTTFGCTSKVPDAASHIADAGYVDWKAAGAAMVDTGLIGLDDKDEIDNVYPVLPFATYTFEFTKQALLESWPDIEANNKQLVTFDTDWWLSLTGLLSGVVDAAVAKDNGDGGLRYLVMALQLNDCARTNNVILKGNSGVPGGDELLSILNCLTYYDPKDLLPLLEYAGFELRPGDAEKLNDKFGVFSKAAQRVFIFVAAAEIGLTLGTAINDLNIADDAERSMYFSPAGNAEKAFSAGPWTWQHSPDKKYQFLIPDGWETVAENDDYYGKESRKVVNAQGETMSTLILDVPLGQGGDEIPPDMQYEKLNKDTIPVYGLRTWNDRTENLVVFHGVGRGETWRARLGVSSFLVSDTDKAWARGFDSSPADPPVGGYFGRTIAEDEALTDVNPSLSGLERLKAYEGTDEYELILTMLESFRDSVPPAGS